MFVINEVLFFSPHKHMCELGYQVVIRKTSQNIVIWCFIQIWSLFPFHLFIRKYAVQIWLGGSAILQI